MMKGEIEWIVAQGMFCLFFVTKDNSVMGFSLLVPFNDPTLQMLVNMTFFNFSFFGWEFRVFFLFLFFLFITQKTWFL